MGRRRRELKKIEKGAARLVSFWKRRRGLIKKAHELSILCEAEVGLIILSAKDKLFEYSNIGMKMILKKYLESVGSSTNAQLYIELENQDEIRIKQEMENTDNTLRHMRGEELQGLTIQELEKLEQMLEVGLHRIQSTKGKQFEEENARLRQELKQCSNSENNNAVELLLLEPLETRDHSQLSESIHDAYTPMSQHKTSIQHNEASDTSLQLGLSI